MNRHCKVAGSLAAELTKVPAMMEANMFLLGLIHSLTGSRESQSHWQLTLSKHPLMILSQCLESSILDPAPLLDDHRSNSDSAYDVIVY